MAKSLGKTLKDAREIMGVTMRQVEEATDISNAYLSQLENDKIKKPSANVLYNLASFYKIDLDTLLAAAGIIQQNSKGTKGLLNSPRIAKQNISEEEEKELLNYLKYLRSRTGE